MKSSIPIWQDADGSRDTTPHPIANAALNQFQPSATDGEPSTSTLYPTDHNAAKPPVSVGPVLGTPAEALAPLTKVAHVRGVPANAVSPLLDDDAELHPTHHNAAAPLSAATFTPPTAASLTAPPHRWFAGRYSFLEWWRARLAQRGGV